MDVPAEFMVLPPYFKDDLSIEDLKGVVPNYSIYPEQFKGAIPMLIASLVHHGEWLADCMNLSENHAYRHCRFFKEGFYIKWKTRVCLDNDRATYKGKFNLLVNNAR
jgi:hypothetical protein